MDHSLPGIPGARGRSLGNALQKCRLRLGICPNQRVAMLSQYRMSAVSPTALVSHYVGAGLWACWWRLVDILSTNLWLTQVIQHELFSMRVQRKQSNSTFLSLLALQFHCVTVGFGPALFFSQDLHYFSWYCTYMFKWQLAHRTADGGCTIKQRDPTNLFFYYKWQSNIDAYFFSIYCKEILQIGVLAVNKGVNR